VIHHRFHLDRSTSSNFSPFVSPAIIVAVALIALLSAAAWALYVAYMAKLINDTYYTGNLWLKSTDVDLAYEGLYLLVCMFALIPAVVIFLREHSLVSFLENLRPLRPTTIMPQDSNH
jgi:hypothetical protein